MEVGLPTLRTTQLDAGGNEAAIEEADFAESRRETILLHLTNYQSVLSKQRQTHVNPKEFQVGDLVLRKTISTAIKPKHRKFGQNWEGLYVITASNGTRSYHLQDMDSRRIPNPWNVANVMNYYH